MRKKQLEIILSQLIPRPRSRLLWEGYPLDAKSAAEMVYIASQVNDDIHGKSVIDLGCGSGVLAISASLLGAAWVVGVDIDKAAIEAARFNAEKMSVDVDLVIGDIGCIYGHFDTVLMNPPFGSRRRGADVQFLKKSLEISNVVYSLHKRGDTVRSFLRRKIETLEGTIDRIYEMEIVIPRIFDFHRKRLYQVKVDLYRILKS